MREIKFRGLTANGTWVYGDLRHDIPNSTLYYEEYPQRICWNEGTKQCNQPIKRGTAGQYTGLKDKNGKEIYEGDIVNVNDGLAIEKGKIDCGKFMSSHEGGYSRYHWHIGFYISDKEGEQLWNWASEDIDWEDVEVIGNIYENPELLK